MVASPDPIPIPSLDLFDRSPCRADNAGSWGSSLFRRELGSDGLPLHRDRIGGIFWRMLGVHPPGAEGGNDGVTDFNVLITDGAEPLITSTYWHERILEHPSEDVTDPVKSNSLSTSSNHKLRGYLE